MKITINTCTLTDESILQSICNNGEILSQTITDTKEGQIREALLKLGWIPPEVVECQNCRFWLKRYKEFERGLCEHRKVLGAQGAAEDGISQLELDVITCGPKFGCIHFKKKGE